MHNKSNNSARANRKQPRGGRTADKSDAWLQSVYRDRGREIKAWKVCAGTNWLDDLEQRQQRQNAVEGKKLKKSIWI